MPTRKMPVRVANANINPMNEDISDLTITLNKALKERNLKLKKRKKKRSRKL